VRSPVNPTGRVYATEWPARTVARTVYQGGYEGLGAAWGEFDQWILTHGHTPAGELWEVYEVGPESGPDASKYRTQLYRPFAEVSQAHT
jgi:effector-binding domain-containing protein